MLQVVHPLALIASPIHMDVDSLPVSLVVGPVAFVDVAVDMCKLTISMGAIVFPGTLIARTIRPNLSAQAVSEPPKPLTSVLCTRAISVGRPLFPFRMWIIRLV